jgi:hypothetical protein
MSNALYHGNKSFPSPGKEGVRALAYSNVQRKLMFQGYHIVVPSRQCGDIRLLLALGISRKRIIAADIDPLAMRAAAKFGVILSPFGDIAQAVEWANQVYGMRNIASVNVDLCFGLNKGIKVLQRVFDARVSVNAKILFTFLRGRDKMTSTEERLRYFDSRIHGRQEHYSYKSFTKDSIGSPMSMVVL